MKQPFVLRSALDRRWYVQSAMCGSFVTIEWTAYLDDAERYPLATARKVQEWARQQPASKSCHELEIVDLRTNRVVVANG